MGKYVLKRIGQALIVLLLAYTLAFFLLSALPSDGVAARYADPALGLSQAEIEQIREQMGVDKSEITRDTHFINDLNADSLDTVELVMEFEDEFELSIPDEEAEKIQTVGQAIDYIRANSAK